MAKFIVGIRSDGIQYVYHTEADSKEDALTKVEQDTEIPRDPYGRNYVEEIKEDVHFVVSYAIHDPYIG